MRILIADDDEDDRGFFCDAIALIDPSIECFQVEDGDAAMKLLTSDFTVFPDLIFLDINMPLMDGKECLVKIKSDPRLKNIPVVMYSTSSDAKEMEHCQQLGARAFIVKPSDFQTLLKSLTAVLQG